MIHFTNSNFVTLLSLCALVLITIRCGDKEEPLLEPSYDQIDVVTGIQMTDENGQFIGTWKQPNEKRGGMTVFPNPVLSSMKLIAPHPKDELLLA